MKVNQKVKTRIAEVVQERAGLIGRQSLNDVEVKEIEVLSSNNHEDKFICRIRGMTYAVSIGEGAERFGTFEAGEITKGTGCRLTSHRTGGMDTEYS